MLTNSIWGGAPLLPCQKLDVMGGWVFLGGGCALVSRVGFANILEQDIYGKLDGTHPKHCAELGNYFTQNSLTVPLPGESTN